MRVFELHQVGGRRKETPGVKLRGRKTSIRKKTLEEMPVEEEEEEEEEAFCMSSTVDL